jgi:hypothetical protein
MPPALRSPLGTKLAKLTREILFRGRVWQPGWIKVELKPEAMAAH